VSYDDYEDPGSGGSFTPSKHPEWVGKLFLIWPIRVDARKYPSKQPGQQGVMEDVEVVVGDVACIDIMDPETGKPLFLKSCDIGGKGMVRNLREKVGRKVLGRLYAGPATNGSGGTFYALNKPEESDKALAHQYEQAFPRPVDPYEAPGGTTAPAAPAWLAQPPAQPVAPAWQQQTVPATPPAAQWQAPGAPATAQPWQGQTQTAPPAQAAPAAPQWQAPAPPAPPVPAQPPAPDWKTGPLGQFLAQRGIDLNQIASEDQAVQLASTFPAQ